MKIENILACKRINLLYSAFSRFTFVRLLCSCTLKETTLNNKVSDWVDTQTNKRNREFSQLSACDWLKSKLTLMICTALSKENVLKQCYPLSVCSLCFAFKNLIK